MFRLDGDAVPNPPILHPALLGTIGFQVIAYQCHCRAVCVVKPEQ